MDKKISQLNEVIVPEGTDVIAIVNNGETKKIKVENIGEFINKPLGWGRYDDNQWTEVSPLPLVNGVSVILSNNASNTIEEGDFSFFDSTTQKIKAQNVNDTYSITIVFKAKTSNANQTHLEVDFYSPVGDFDRLSQGVVFYKGRINWRTRGRLVGSSPISNSVSSLTAPAVSKRTVSKTALLIS